MSRDARTREFVGLLTQNERRVYAYILSLVPNWADADDILQETNLRLWDEYDKYVSGSDFAAWAISVAHYQILTYRKRRQGERRHFSTEFVAAVAVAAAETDNETDALNAVLETCVKKLSTTNRELLRECYAAGAKIKNVATRLGRSIPATYRALSRIRSALHQCVEEGMREHGEAGR